MKVIVDTSVFISALISSKGIHAELLMNPIYSFRAYSCYYLVKEIFKHKEKVLKFSGFSEDELIEQVYKLLKNITLINEEQINSENWEKAYNLTKDIDENDTAFVALTDYLEGKLWSLDKKLVTGLAQKGYTKIATIKELKQYSIGRSPEQNI